MSINFKTSNLVIGRYNPGAGGKFIFNCLALSTGFVFQDADFAQQQLDGHLSVQDKYNILFGRLEQSKDKWSDLEMGCDLLFGDLDYDHVFTAVPETMNFNSVISKLSHSDTRFCLAAHTWPTFTRILEVWPNACVIFFENDRDFFKATRRKYLYPGMLINYWNSVRGPDWPDWPPADRLEYAQLEPFIRDELENLFHNRIMDYLFEADVMARIELEKNKIKTATQSTHSTVVWDCAWFLDESTFIKNIRNLYEYFSLEDFNKTLILNFYRSWLGSLKNIEQTNPMVWGTAKYQ